MVVWRLSDWAYQTAAANGSGRTSPQFTKSAPTAVGGYGSMNAPSPRAQIMLGTAGLLALGACVVLTSRQLGYWQDTTTLFEHALQVTRNNSCAHFSLGNQLADQGKLAEAMKHWEAALNIEPTRPDIQARIAAALSQQGDFAGAITRYRRALQIDPDNPEGLNNLAWLLATCPAGSFRDGPEAVRLAEKACELTRSRRTIMVGTLAAAYAEAGRFPNAIETAQKACALAADEGDRLLVSRNQGLLELYRAGKSYHEPAAP
jgi:tetratricopeptide (TPR) repeat protein